MGDASSSSEELSSTSARPAIPRERSASREAIIAGKLESRTHTRWSQLLDEQPAKIEFGTIVSRAIQHAATWQGQKSLFLHIYAASTLAAWFALI